MNQDLAQHIFAGDSEMARRMRAMDWAATAFGPLAKWPQSLRTAVSICIASRFPMIVWWGPTLSVLYNDAYIPIFQQKHPSALGKTGREACGEAWDVFSPLFERVMKDGGAAWSEDKLLELRRRGFPEEAYFSWSHSPIRDESGHAGGVFTTVMETTDRVLSARRLLMRRELQHEGHRPGSPAEPDPAKAAFFELPERAPAHTTDAAPAESALRENRDVLALAMRGGRMGAWSRNLTTNDVWWSRELEELFGLEPGGFAGTTDGFHAFVHEDDRQSLVEAVSHAIRTRTDYLLEFRYRHASGQWRWMEGRGRATYASDGRPVMLYGLGIDLTERKTAEDAVEQARNAAETANRLKDQFLATLSHELRTPLNAILGYARMLRTNSIAEGKRERAIEIIERNAVAQNQLVEDLLDVARITTGKVRLELEPLPAARAILEAVEAVRPTADAKRIALDVDVDPLAGTVIGDGTRLEQVFRNLLSNAVKFTNDGGTIGVVLRALGARTITVISDNGIGIAPEFLPHVFDPFRQADARFSREHGGLGLGLAICKQLVELHGGNITAESGGVGRGATFTVSLPNHQIAQPPASDDEADGHLASTVAGILPAALEGVDSLIVDGEADTLELFRELLEGARAVVRTASDGPAALAEFSRRPPGVLIAHLGLPGMDGYALIEQVRARRAEDGGMATAIAVTAFARLDDRARALAAGFDAHLSKPIVPSLFVASVAAAARQKARA